MAKNIDYFISELIDYVNTYIVGSDNTYITEAKPEIYVKGEGHGIPFLVKIPEELKDRCKISMTDFGPVFYAEELLEQYPKASTAAIAENINKEILQTYPGMIRLFSQNLKTFEKTIDDYEDDELIVTALPLGGNADGSPKLDSNHTVTKECETLGLRLIMKGFMSEDPENRSLAYFAPVMEGREVTEEDWEIAKTNSWYNSDVRHIEPFKGTFADICGVVIERHEFYEYFYLLSLEDTWKEVINDTRVETILIFPETPYMADYYKLYKISEEKDTKTIRKILMKESLKKKSKYLPVFELDCRTMKLKRIIDPEC